MLCDRANLQQWECRTFFTYSAVIPTYILSVTTYFDFVYFGGYLLISAVDFLIDRVVFLSSLPVTTVGSVTMPRHSSLWVFVSYMSMISVFRGTSCIVAALSRKPPLPHPRCQLMSFTAE